MMSTEDNKATVRRWIEEGGNQGNVAVFDELSAPNWVYHDPNFPDAHTLADYKRSITEARSAFPDFHTTIEDLIAEGDKVVMRSTWRGTNRQTGHRDDNHHRPLCRREGSRSLERGG